MSEVARVVMYSGGVGSWAAAKRVAEKYGTDNLILLFMDTLVEDADTYKFLRASAANVGGELVEISEGRTIWEVFRDEKFLGNSKADPCSKILKRRPATRWIRKHYKPDQVVVYVGIDWSEINRFEKMRPRKLPYQYEAPLCEPPYLNKTGMNDWANREGLWTQRLYTLGMSHANCGGGCVRMGQGGFALLLKGDRPKYLEWEQHEQELRDLLGDVSILRDRIGGAMRPLTLRELRESIEEKGEEPDLFDLGGCGCFVD